MMLVRKDFIYIYIYIHIYIYIDGTFEIIQVQNLGEDSHKSLGIFRNPQQTVILLK